MQEFTTHKCLINIEDKVNSIRFDETFRNVSNIVTITSILQQDELIFIIPLLIVAVAKNLFGKRFHVVTPFI